MTAKLTYILIFLPFISALLCQILPKRTSALIALTSFLSAILLSLWLFYKIFLVEKIGSNFTISPISLALEFNIDALSINFILFTIFAQTIIFLFYKKEIFDFLNKEKESLFYSVYLLQSFAIIGFFSSNNLINLFLFLEIYSISFFAIFSASNNKKINKLSLTYFLINIAASLFLLFCLLIIYLNFDSFDLNLIKNNLLAQENKILFRILSLALLACFIFIFFPLYICFKNLKNNNLFSIFLIAQTIFITANLGIFLFLKFHYLFFSKISISFILSIAASALIIISSWQIFFSKHLKIVAINLCLNQLAFLILCLALNSEKSLSAFYLYWLNFNLINLFLFIFASFLKKKINNSIIDNLSCALENGSISSLEILPLKFILFFSLALPFTFLFYANYNLSLASLEYVGSTKSNLMQNLAPTIILFLIISLFSYLVFCSKIILQIFAYKKTYFAKPESKPFYSILFWLLFVIIFYVNFNVATLESSTENFVLNYFQK